MECSGTPRIVITPGSSNCRAGFSGENAPRAVVPSVLGTLSNQVSAGRDSWYCGRETVGRRSELMVTHIIQHGIVTNLPYFEKLIQDVFSKELKVDPEDHAVLVSEAPVGPKANRENLTRLMFESFNVAALSLKLDMILSLIGSGRKTGMVVSSGGSKTHAVPVYEGYGLPHAIMRLDMGGDHVTSELTKLLSTQDCSGADWESLNSVKEKLGYVAGDYGQELIKTESAEESYSLPDGRVVRLGRERFQCTESLFNPSLVNRQSPGISDSTYQSIMKCDVDIRKILCGNVLLSGGNSMLKGMDTRVQRDLSKLAPSNTPVNLIATPDRDQLDWFGGALLASLPMTIGGWVTRREYDESGPSIVHRKCA